MAPPGPLLGASGLAALVYGALCCLGLGGPNAQGPVFAHIAHPCLAPTRWQHLYRGYCLHYDAATTCAAPCIHCASLLTPATCTGGQYQPFCQIGILRKIPTRIWQSGWRFPPVHMPGPGRIRSASCHRHRSGRTVGTCPRDTAESSPRPRRNPPVGPPCRRARCSGRRPAEGRPTLDDGGPAGRDTPAAAPMRPICPSWPAAGSRRGHVADDCEFPC